MIKRTANGYIVECDSQNCNNHHEYSYNDPCDPLNFKEIIADMEDYDWTCWKDDFGEWKHFCPLCNFTKKVD